MKRDTIITITIIVYLVALLGMFFGVDQFVKSKDQRLRAEMHNKIDEIFAGRNAGLMLLILDIRWDMKEYKFHLSLSLQTYKMKKAKGYLGI